MSVFTPSNPPEAVRGATMDKVLNLGRGQPSDILPARDVFEKAASQAFETEGMGMLHYGSEKGRRPFREQLLDLTSRQYALPHGMEKSEHTAQNFITTNGSSYGLYLSMNMLSKAGDTVFVEDPIYHLGLGVLKDHGLNIVPIRSTENGIDLDDLNLKLKDYSPRFLYAITDHSNPSATNLAENKREALVRISRKSDFAIICDDVYQMLQFKGKSKPPLVRYDEMIGSFGQGEFKSGSVVSLGSFSKILAPGLRLGWIEGSTEMAEKLSKAMVLNSAGGMNTFTSGIVTGIIKRGELDQYMDLVRTSLGSRCEALCKGLTDNCPSVSFTKPEGGYFVWAELPQGLTVDTFLPIAQEEGVSFIPGPLFTPKKDKHGRHMRLAFSWYNEDELAESTKRLATAIAKAKAM
eukprot:TRINITY_DN32607_c0_g1_i1.p1 TRINITY_DN32607_c0_g1~~TRINITY_DN32607_c0_g1_i1.p1  ORF type:complete len:424 (+),score=74.10 TRINITY_DN32607_c0_g1_i1:53-1273(+)